MKKICTTIPQSLRLIQLGIDLGTADMFWDTLISKTPECHVNNRYFIDEWNDDNTYPAWSLSALLDLIPAGRALYHDVINNKYVFTGNTRSGLYKDPVDAAFEVVCSLLENKDKNDESKKVSL